MQYYLLRGYILHRTSHDICECIIMTEVEQCGEIYDF